MTHTYITGAVVRVSAPFRTSGVAVDPTTVQAKIRTPDGTVTTYTYGTDSQLVKDSTGNYHVDVTTTADGTHTVRFSSTGVGAAADEVAFFTRSQFV
jgi:hypothetical protein